MLQQLLCRRGFAVDSRCLVQYRPSRFTTNPFFYGRRHYILVYPGGIMGHGKALHVSGYRRVAFKAHLRQLLQLLKRVGLGRNPQ